MPKLISLLSLLSVLAGYNGDALGASSARTLKVAKSVEISAPASKVWHVIDDFNALHRWLPTIEETQITKGQNNKPDAIRLLSLRAGGTVEQKLLAYDADGMSYTYNILRGVLPVSDYESTIKVEPAGRNQTKVNWTSTFRRKDTGDKPAPGADDKAAIMAVSSAYQAGLTNLKRIAERDNSGRNKK
jgi:carbon monoxide dehydrogenase subunit G